MSANPIRDRPINSFTLSFMAMAMLEELAEEHGMTKSGYVEHMIRESAFEDQLDKAQLKRRATQMVKELEEKKAYKRRMRRRRENVKRPRPEK